MKAVLAWPEPLRPGVPVTGAAPPSAVCGLVETVAVTAPAGELALTTLTAIVSLDVCGVTISWSMCRAGTGSIQTVCQIPDDGE